MTERPNVRELAQYYAHRNFSPIPLPQGSKTPVIKGWPNFNVGKDGYDLFQENGNIGVILGSPSKGLVDIDCDWPETREIASALLSYVPSFGRKTARGSHRLVRVDGKAQSKKYKLPEACKGLQGLPDEHALCVVEIRGDGQQTMFPGSIHPNGELIEWESSEGIPEIPKVLYDELEKLIGLISFLAVVSRFYPEKGSRDDMHMPLAGTLARLKMSAGEINRISVMIARINGDEEAEKRGKGEAAIKRLEAGDAVTGLPQLVKALGLPEECIKTFGEWLQISGQKDNESDWLQKMNEKHAVIRNWNGKCRVATVYFDTELNRKCIDVQTFADIKNAYLNKIVTIMTEDGPTFKSAGDWWLKHSKRREYEKVGFYPKGGPDDVLNLWDGFAIKPVQGDWPLMRNHILEVLACGDQKIFEYIIKWLAFAVQYPEKQAEVVLVLKGGRGTGKGKAFGGAICKIFGQHGLQISNSEHLAGRFNGHLADVCFLFADETYWPGNVSAEGDLKRLISEDTLAIEKKGIDIVTVVNRLHIVIASNEDWIVPAATDERRFAVFEISSKYQQDKAYFGKLFAEQDNGGLAAMLYDLLQMDISSWHPRDDIPKTAALSQQKIQGLKPIERAWFECLARGEITCFDQNREGYYLSTKDFAAYANSLLLSRRKITEHSAGLFLGKPQQNKDGSLRQQKCMGFEKINMRPRGYLIPELSEARMIWNKVMFIHEWDEQDKWDVDYGSGGGEKPF